jgi:Golgi phosphoprotein 3
VLACEDENMTRHDGLHLYEQIMLLALRGEEGTVASGAMCNYAVGGAVLAELLLSGRIEIDEPRPRKKLVTPVSSEPMGDDLLDECLGRIVGAKRRRGPAGWVSAFASVRQLRHRVAAQLCRRGILEEDRDNVLLVFTRRVYPEINPEPERRLVERLQDAIFTETQEIDPRTIVLVSLASSTNILPVVFNRKELKARKKRIEQIANGEVAGKAAQDAIAAAQTAAMVAAMMPAMMAGTMVTAAH